VCLCVVCVVCVCVYAHMCVRSVRSACVYVVCMCGAWVGVHVCVYCVCVHVRVCEHVCVVCLCVCVCVVCVCVLYDKCTWHIIYPPGFALSVVVSFPMMIFPCRASINSLISQVLSYNPV